MYQAKSATPSILKTTARGNIQMPRKCDHCYFNAYPNLEYEDHMEYMNPP